MGIIFDALKQNLGPFDDSYSLSSYKERGNEPKYMFALDYLNIHGVITSVIGSAATKGDSALFNAIASTISEDIDLYCNFYFESAKSVFDELIKNESLVYKKELHEKALTELFKLEKIGDEPTIFIDLCRKRIKESLIVSAIPIDHKTKIQLSIEQMKTLAATLDISTADVGIHVLFGYSMYDFHPYFFDVDHITADDFCNYIALGHVIVGDESKDNQAGKKHYLCQSNIPDSVASNPIINGLGRLQSSETSRPYNYEVRRYELFKAVFKEDAQANFALEEFIGHEFDELCIVNGAELPASKELTEFGIVHEGLYQSAHSVFQTKLSRDVEFALLMVRHPRNIFSAYTKGENVNQRMKNLMTSISARRDALSLLDDLVGKKLSSLNFPTETLALCEQILSSIGFYSTNQPKEQIVLSTAANDLTLPNICNLIAKTLSSATRDKRASILCMVGMCMPLKSWEVLVNTETLTQQDTLTLLQKGRFKEGLISSVANIALHFEQLTDFAACCENKYPGLANEFLRMDMYCCKEEFERMVMRKINHAKNFVSEKNGDADLSYLTSPSI